MNPYKNAPYTDCGTEGSFIIMNTFGLVLGAFTFVLIGVFHVVVIKGEYYFSKKIWPLFLILGILSLGKSLFTGDTLESGLWAILGMTFLWSILELFQQEKRVEKGWFPRNPNRKDCNRNK